MREILMHFSKLPKQEISTILSHLELFKATIILPLKKLNSFYSELNLSDEQKIVVNKPNENEGKSTLVKDKTNYFCVETRIRLVSIITQFSIVCVLYIGLGLYFILESLYFYRKMDLSLNVFKYSAYRLPYSTLMISAMRGEFFIVDKLADEDGVLIYDTYAEKFKNNEISFQKNRLNLSSYYHNEIPNLMKVEASSVCSMFLSSNSDDCIEAFNGLMRYGMEHGVNTMIEYIATTIYILREINYDPPPNMTKWINDTCHDEFFQNVSKLLTQLIIIQCILLKLMKVA